MGVCDYEVLHTGKDGFVLGEQGDSGVDMSCDAYAHLLPAVQAQQHWNHSNVSLTDTMHVALQIGCTRFLGPSGTCWYTSTTGASFCLLHVGNNSV